MTSKERILTTINHKQPDRVPVDFGSTSVTGIHVSCVAGLRDHYGLEKRPVKVHEPHQMLGWVDEDLKQAMGVDVEGMMNRKTAYGFVNEGWKCWRTPHGQEVLVPRDFNATEDADYVYMHPQGDTSVPPSGKMPKDGYFFDAIIRQEPIDEDKLNPEDNMEEFGPISDDDLWYLRGESERARATGRAVIAKFSGLGLGDIAAVPAPFLKNPKGIRDITEWYISTTSRRDYIHAVFAKQVEYGIQNLEKIHQAIGDSGVDAVFTCGTDFGTQSSSFCSVKTFRELYMPYYKQVNDWIHEHTPWKTFKHSCGSVEKFIPSFIEAGFDILNPVQCSAAHMDPDALKAKYGDQVVFWGGGIDTQKTLPFGTPEEVRRQVLSRCEVFAKGGGFVFNSIHNVQARTPIENIVAMIDAVHEFNGVAR